MRTLIYFIKNSGETGANEKTGIILSRKNHSKKRTPFLNGVIQFLIILMLVLSGMIMTSGSVNAQCSRPTCLNVTSLNLTSTSWQTVSNSLPDGNSYRRYDCYLIAGYTYEFSTCSSDGGSADYDTYLCLKTDGALGYGCGLTNMLAYNDDY
jgi:hypothetical protein